MDNKKIRLANLLILKEECSPQTFAELERRTGVKANYIYQIEGGRGMGDQVARRLETGMGKEKGWMDTPHDGMALKLDPTEIKRLVAAMTREERLQWLQAIAAQETLESTQ